MRAGMCGTMQGRGRPRRGVVVGGLDLHIFRPGPGSSEFIAVCHRGASRQQMRGVRDFHVALLSLIIQETKARDWPRAGREEASEPVR